MTITVRHSAKLQAHLETFEVDGTTVADAFFEGGRLAYPGRKDIEQQLGHTEPYTIEHEARVIDGLPVHVQAAIRVLSRTLQRWVQKTDGYTDPSLDVLWEAHASYIATPDRGGGEISLDRLVAALTMVKELLISVESDPIMEKDPYIAALGEAAMALIAGLESLGFPPSSESLEELFDGAPPACVGLGMIDIDWKPTN